MTLTDYEMERQRRIEENKRKLEQLELPQLLEDMDASGSGAAEQVPRRKRRPAAEKSAELLEPSRRSKRTEGKERPCYVFEAERGGGGPRQLHDGPLVKEGECEEVYGLAHVLALGSTKLEWEMFTDGYNEAGERIYDPEKGLSCHQCRQKTLGQRTKCSRCKSGVGVLCGDCLFARYGEHVEEAAADESWVCPCCRDLCNCSRHRKLRKWEATGQLHRSVKSRGYLSVAHYLVLNKAGGLAAKRAALDSGFCPPSLAEKLEVDVKELEEAAANAPPPEEQPAVPDAVPAAPAAGGQAGKVKKARSKKAADGTAAPAAAAAKPGKCKAGPTKVAAGGKAKPGKKQVQQEQQPEGVPKQTGKQHQQLKEGKQEQEPKQASKKTAAAAGKRQFKRTTNKQSMELPAAAPAAAASVLEPSGASGSGAVAPADAAAEVNGGAAAGAAEAALAVPINDSKGGKGQRGRKSASGKRRGAATLEEAAVPSKRRARRA
ncbi:hypothetical protein D9Q98_003734 [Chlorella vulgaris]|uniref:Zinc-finger domain-containing protein n=1 Tax=Chlorella vulgaris TaxID=3077 RepID=A0A9D4TTA9_CHLVU|nr:hypothetical protein D9Q98_003734 [Chlorella vulgaris]